MIRRLYTYNYTKAHMTVQWCVLIKYTTTHVKLYVGTRVNENTVDIATGVLESSRVPSSG